jgi:hypothetical protein
MSNMNPTTQRKKASLPPESQLRLATMLNSLPVVAGERRLDALAELLCISRVSLMRLMRGESLQRAVTLWVQHRIETWEQPQL